MAVLFASPYFTVFDNAGNIISGGKAKFYLAGTTTPQEVWADRALTTTRGATVTADSAGRFPDIWVPETISYRVQILDANDVLLEDVDYAIQATATTAATTTAGAEVKNILVNGGMDVWSLGTSFSNVGGAATLSETADGWFVSQVSTAGNSVTRQTGTSGSSRYGFRFGRPNSNTTTGQIRVLQGIETGLVYRYAGKQVTVSFWAYQGANFSGTNLSVTLATGTAEAEALTGLPNGTWTGQINAVSQVQGLTTTATRYQFTATLAANIREIGLMLAYTPSGTAGANDWVQIENVQIEGAGQATEFAARQTALDFLNARVNQPPTAANFRAAFGLGTASTANTGTSGNTVPFLDGANTWSAAQTFTLAPVFTDGPGSRTALGLGTANSPQFAAIELGNASDTTIARVSAGLVSIEGNVIYTASNLPGTGITWTATQTFAGTGVHSFSGDIQVNKATAGLDLVSTGTNVTNIQLRNASRYDDIRNTTSGLSIRVDTTGTPREMLFSSAGVLSLPTGTAQLPIRPLTTTTGTLVVADRNCAGTLTGGITLPNSVFSAGDMLFVNAGAANRTITRGAGIAMHLNGTDVATATLPANTGGGIFWETASKAILTGAFQ